MCLDLVKETEDLSYKPVICVTCTDLYIELRRRQRLIDHYHRPGDDPYRHPFDDSCELCWTRKYMMEEHGECYVREEICNQCHDAIERLAGFPETRNM